MASQIYSRTAAGVHRARRARLARFALSEESEPFGAGADAGTAISSLRVYPLREPASAKRYTVVRAETDAGISGYGECAFVSAAELAQAKNVVVGLPVTAGEVVRRRLAPWPRVQAAVNMALLDLVGKFAKAPLYQVLGGPTRNKVRILTELKGGSSEALLAAMSRARQAGCRAFLVPVPPAATKNQGQAFVRAAQTRLEKLRAAGGEDLDFVLDGRGTLSPGDASSLAAAFERFHLLWFEEPCPVSNLAPLRKIAAETVTPLGLGREMGRTGEFQDLLREGLVDVLRPDIGSHGISSIRKLAALAETYYVAVAPYHTGGPIATAAALHLAASLPNFFIQQIPLPQDEADRTMRDELAGAPIEQAQDGFTALPTGPGLGINVRNEALEKYRDNSA